MTGLVGLQGEFAAAISFERLPAEVVASVKERVLDTVGVALAAGSLAEGQAAARVARSWGGAEQAGAIGLPGRFPAPASALVNGTLAHSLDFDDTHLPSILHPSAALVPAALAAGGSGREVIAALAAGYELCVRLGMAAYDEERRNNVFFEKGLHATSICGTLAAAAVGAKLAGLDAAGIAHAIGVAASMGAGLIEANRTGGSVKRLHCGWAAHAGLAAAQLAAAGFTGPPTVLEGRFGFYQALCDGRFDPDAVVDGLGERWETPGIFYKPYPANHFTHAAIDAALALRAEGLDLAAIERIDLGVAAPTLRTIAEPPEQKARPATGYASQFSGPFAVAAALVGGGGLGLYLDDFTDERARDPERLRLAALVRCHADPECDALYPRALPAVLRVTLRGGEVRERRALENRRLSAEEVALKFRLNASRALPPERVERLEALCARLDELDSVSELEGAWAPA